MDEFVASTGAIPRWFTRQQSPLRHLTHSVLFPKASQLHRTNTHRAVTGKSRLPVPQAPEGTPIVRGLHTSEG